MPPVPSGLGRSRSSFNLDVSGVAGFFGGDEAVSAMATVHIYKGRKWLGWYNSPGSYNIAKRYGLLAKSRFWSGLYPGTRIEPSILFELDGKAGPKFIASHSGTILPQTSYLGYLFRKTCTHFSDYSESIEGRKDGERYKVTVARLASIPEKSTILNSSLTRSLILSIIPIIVSIGCCVACAVFQDWYGFCVILAGVIANGLTSFMVGSATLTFSHPTPAHGSPKGDGLLIEGNHAVVLLGMEGAVNSVTRGKFSLTFTGKEQVNCMIPKHRTSDSEPHLLSRSSRSSESSHHPIPPPHEPTYDKIGWCAAILTLQFLAQLMLVPQASLFGQILFLVSLGASWGYNCYLTSLDKETIQGNILYKILKEPNIREYSLPTRTAMVTFVLLMLNPQNRDSFFDLLPTTTPVWKKWREKVEEELAKPPDDMTFDIVEDVDVGDVDGKDAINLLQGLLRDSRDAFNGWRRLQTLRKDCNEFSTYM